MNLVTRNPKKGISKKIGGVKGDGEQGIGNREWIRREFPLRYPASSAVKSLLEFSTAGNAEEETENGKEEGERENGGVEENLPHQKTY